MFLLAVTHGPLSFITPTRHFAFMTQLQAAETEIKDLQSEFELEKIDYLNTIRRLERDSMLFQQLLDQVQSLIRRDCNYSNLEKIKHESVWDEEAGCWKIPEPVIQKTHLPAGKRSIWIVPPHVASSELTSTLIHGVWTALTCKTFHV